ncbi:Protein of unknown function [Chitinophaga sp. YR573]|uniref:DUF3575 domain-containing protein n=1 Tax=Chitinophaga sp. YR573 TaxID=1881040 RepID=UPI0008BACC20|nr:DUF3575 domain-containing protein [Chitinophaga sp. YR573]SEW26024.1 Protein of unknown function [Chitinophaga sp. YR573]
MKKLLPIFCTIIFLANLSYGQRSRYPKEGQFPRTQGVLLSTNVLSLFDLEGGPSLGLEYRFALNWAVAVDATAIMYTLPEVYSSDDGNHSGYRIQPQIKYYFGGRRRSFRGYISLMAMYKDVHYDKTTSGGQYYNGTEYITVDPVPYTEHKKIIAGSFNIGMQKFLDEERHIFIEPYAGVGLRHKERTGRPYVNGAYDNDYNDDDGVFDLKDGMYPHLSWGLKFGVRF